MKSVLAVASLTALSAIVIGCAGLGSAIADEDADGISSADERGDHSGRRSTKRSRRKPAHALAGQEAQTNDDAAPGLPTTRPSPTTARILASIAGYQGWPRFVENRRPLRSASHDGTWVVAFYNHVVERAMSSAEPLPLPNGAILVKENRPSPDAAPAVLTIMSKEGDEWYWAKTTLDGQVVVDDGEPVEGAVESCRSCHAAARANDYVFTHPFQASP